VKKATFRFHAELNRLFPERRREQDFPYTFERDLTIKHGAESLGVPHTEIGVVLVNGSPAGLSDLLQDGDRVDVYPHEPSAGGLDAARFVVDVNLGKLATYLRMLGFDVAYLLDADDDTLARIAQQEDRILLTRDRGLLKRKMVEKGYCVVIDRPAAQVRDVLDHFHLAGQARPFQRCLSCNGLLEPVSRDEVVDRLPTDTRRYFNEFWLCHSCGKIYWKGSHYERMRRFVRRVLND